MQWKEIGKKLLFPPVWLLVILTVLSAVLLSLVFVKGWEQTVLAYGVYVLSFYTLCAGCLFFIKVWPKYRLSLKQRIKANPFARRYLSDAAYRARISLHTSLGVSVLYVVIQLLFWYFNRSWWFVILAAYYTVLATMRYLLLGYVRKNTIGTRLVQEWKRARLCACILLLINLCLSAAVLMILYQNKGFAYPGITVYVMALFTFYSTIYAAVDLIKHRKGSSPVLSAKKTVDLSAAVVSLLNLETAMFAQFGGEMSLEHQHLFIILTGAGVSVTVVTLSVLLIVKATKEIRR